MPPSPYPLPPERFEYKTLPDPNTWIRLLEILDGPSESTIRCISTTVTLLEAPLYAAISYTWGSKPSKEHPAKYVLVDDLRLEIWDNCHNALNQIRSNLSRIQGMGLNHIFIDSISINQEDLKEKAAQVQIMGSDIFPRATWVFACIGPDSDGSAELMYELSRREEQSVNHSPIQSEDRRFCDACLALGNRPYWRRLWILPELLTAKGIQIFCGTQMMHWQSLTSYLDYLPREEEERDPVGVDWLKIWYTPLGKVRRSMKSAKPRITMEDLERILLVHSDWECADPRDRFYAFWSMIDWPKGTHTEVDYRITATQLALNVFRLTSSLCEAKLLSRACTYLLRLLRVFEVKEYDLQLPLCTNCGPISQSRYPHEINRSTTFSWPSVTGSQIFVDVSDCRLTPIIEDEDGNMTVKVRVEAQDPRWSTSIVRPSDHIPCRPLFKGTHIFGWLCPGATFGDVLLEFQGEISNLYLVLRPFPKEAPIESNTFEVVGQATIEPGFDISIDSYRAGDSLGAGIGGFARLCCDMTDLRDLVFPTHLDRMNNSGERKMHYLRPALLWPSSSNSPFVLVSSFRSNGLGRVLSKNWRPLQYETFKGKTLSERRLWSDLPI